jgi:DNA-binding NarL/FixJ family response regulator
MQIEQREVEVLALLVGGLSNKQIARQLTLSAHTVGSQSSTVTAR